jgi:hypothetical protein
VIATIRVTRRLEKIAQILKKYPTQYSCQAKDAKISTAYLGENI